jgi:heptaprenyl diphosphate synthase
MHIQTFIERAEAQLMAALSQPLPTGPAQPGLLLDAARQICLAPGAKRARPRLAFHFAQLVDCPMPRAVEIGAAAEMIHAASLLHDDVIDEATVRRGVETANARWGATAAVLSGDLLLTLAFQQVRAHPPEVTFEAVELVATMTRAVMSEVTARGLVDLPIARWRAIAEGKTGALFGWCGQAAARNARAEGGDVRPLGDAWDRFDRVGRHLGVAFQIADDLNDALHVGTGKARFTDLRNRSPSYLTILTRDRSPAFARALAESWATPEAAAAAADTLGRMVIEEGAAAQARQDVEVEIAKAFEALGPYAAHPAAKDLAAWAELLWQGMLNRAP